MNITELQNILPILIAAVGGFFGGGWFSWRRKRAAMTAGMATKEFADINEMIGMYTTRVDELAEDYTSLKLELIEAKAREAQLRQEKEALEKELTDLRAK